MPANKWLATKASLAECPVMMIGSHVIPEQVPVAATARLDRKFASRDRKDWLRQIRSKIQLAIIWRIPVGFEDETGFHLGVQQVHEDKAMDWERASLFVDGKHF